MSWQDMPVAESRIPHTRGTCGRGRGAEQQKQPRPKKRKERPAPVKKEVIYQVIEGRLPYRRNNAGPPRQIKSLLSFLKL